MTPEQAQSICQFVEQYKDHVGAIVIACEQGASRSPAVALSLCRHYGWDDRHLRDRYSPNQHVYQLVLEAARTRKAGQA